MVTAKKAVRPVAKKDIKSGEGGAADVVIEGGGRVNEEGRKDSGGSGVDGDSDSDFGEDSNGSESEEEGGGGEDGF